MTEPQMPPADELGDVVPAHPAGGRRRTRTTVLIAATAVGTLAVVGAGTYAAVALSGGGAQPEDVLPGNAMAFVKLDLDPAAGQKLNVYDLTKKFPAAGDLGDADSLRDDLLRKAFKDYEGELDYDTDLKPWLGDRVGMAVVPSGEDEPDVVVAVAYTDRDKAQASMEKARAEAPEGSPVEFAVVDDYVLISDDADAVRDAADGREHLSDDSDYSDAVSSLGGDQIVLGWTDLERVWDAVPPEARDALAEQSSMSDYDLSGQLVMGVHAESDAVELVGKGIDVKTGIASSDSLTTGPGSGTIRDLPAQSFAAMSVSGLGAAVTQGWKDFETTLETTVPGWEDEVAKSGLSLPDDLVTILGTETAVGAWGTADEPNVLSRTRTDDPGKAVQLLRDAFDALGVAETGESFDDYVRESDGEYLAGTPAAVEADERGLGAEKDFSDAVPDADTAGFALWFSIPEIAELAGQPVDENVKPLNSFGATMSGGSNGEFKMRLTFR